MPQWKTAWRFLKSLRIELPYDLAIILLGIHPEKNMIRKDTCTLIFITVLFTIAKKTWKQSKCPLADEWIKKMEYYSAIKKNEIMSFAASQSDLEIIILNEISLTKKDKCHKYHMILLIGGI